MHKINKLLFLLAFSSFLSAHASPLNEAVIIVSGGAAVSPFTTPDHGCVENPQTGASSAGPTDSFLRQYLLAKNYRVFTSPANLGNGQVPAVTDEAHGGPFGPCPPALPDYMTVNSAGDIQLAGTHLANFIEYLRRKYNIRKVHLVAHSMGGLYSRSAIQYMQQTKARTKVLSLTTLGTPWEGTFFARKVDNRCDGQAICQVLLNEFEELAPVVMVEMNPDQMIELNKYNEGALSQIPVTLIAGNAFTKTDGDHVIWPNDGIVAQDSALAKNLSANVIGHRRCYLYQGGTHSTWVSKQANIAASYAITWNSTVGDWVDMAIRESGTAMSSPNGVGCNI